MRLNKFLSLHTSLSRRSADKAIADGRIIINEHPANLGDQVGRGDVVFLDAQKINSGATELKTIVLNKPTGYVCSKNGQGNKTVYELLPEEYQHLNCVGRLDKDSSGLLLLTNNGDLANQLTHPRHQKIKLYVISLDKPLQPLHQQMISDYGINLEDGKSRLILEKLDNASSFRITMHEGRNRQIRRTFSALGYRVKALHRTNFGDYSLGTLKPGNCTLVD